MKDTEHFFAASLSKHRFVKCCMVKQSGGRDVILIQMTPSFTGLVLLNVIGYAMPIAIVIYELTTKLQ